MRARLCWSLYAVTAIGYGLTQVFHTDPVKAQWSGWTSAQQQYNYVSEVVTLNADSLGPPAYTQLFVGLQQGSGNYEVHVKSYPGGVFDLAHGSALPPAADHRWVTFELEVEHPDSFVRGRRYEFRFQRGSSRLHYYYDYCATQFDSMIVPGDDQPPPGPLRPALAMRCRGSMRYLDSLDWGATGFIPVWYGGDTSMARRSDERRLEWQTYAESAGVGWVVDFANWDIIQPESGAWHPEDFDAHLWAAKEIGARPVVCLNNCPKWASSRAESVWTSETTKKFDTTTHAAPKGLWAAGSGNYWRTYFDALVDHHEADTSRRMWDRPCDIVHTWELANEVNDTCNHADSFYHGITGWWRRPSKVNYADEEFPGLRGMCSLYVRMAFIARDVLDDFGEHQNDTLLIASMHQALAHSDAYLVRGVDWLRTCYEIADELRGNGPYPWQGVSFHPYQDWGGCDGFKPENYDEQVNAVRAVMQEFGHYVPLWCTEIGWADEELAPGTSARQEARNIQEMLVSTPATRALPRGGYDRSCYWYFCDPVGMGSWGAVEPKTDTPCLSPPYLDVYAPDYAYRQVTEELTGKRFNGRVLSGDPETDTAVRVYEHASPAGAKTWVCWANDPDGAGAGPLTHGVPARTDSLMSQSIDYDGSAVETKVGVQFDGWFGADLTHHPLFLTETGTVSRPDLVVDSVVFIPGSPQAAMPVEIRAYVSNRGNRTTPGQVTVGFYCDDSLFFSCLTDTIEQNSADTVVVLYSSAPSWMHGTHLYTALANPGQEYVEKVSTDDNAGFKRLQVVKFPTGQVDVVVPGGVSNVPVVLFQLSTASWEKDTTGQTPADSARIVQYYYGLKDTLVQDSASSGWFSGAVSDTFWQFLFGDGRYRFAVQAKDGAENTSPVYPDSDHQYVVFDTTAAVGSMTINNDARFLNVNQCSVQVTACDSGTGIAAMRLGCRWPANLTADGFRFAAAVHFRPAGA